MFSFQVFRKLRALGEINVLVKEQAFIKIQREELVHYVLVEF